MLKKYVGNKTFYKTVLTVAVPMMLQDFITNLVSLFDNLMVGATGTEQMSGVSIVNQINFVYILAVFGAMSGAGIFTAQFFGKGDEKGIRYTFRYKMIFALILGIAAILIFLFAGEWLISLYIHEGSSEGDLQATLLYATQYMRILATGLLPFAAAMAYSSTLRENGETFAPMMTGFTAVVINCVLNYFLIFGKGPFPELGVRGAAIATVISRYAECVCLMIYTYVKRNRFMFIKGAFSSVYIPSTLLKRIFVKGTPLLFNEFVWSAGMSLLSMSYSLHGIDVVAGFSICSTVTNLFNITFLALGTSVGIIVGRQLGASEFDEAVDTVRKLIVFSMAVSAFIAGLLFSTAGLFPRFYNTSAGSKEIAEYFIKCSALFFPVMSFLHCSYFTIRSGGKTFITILFDSVFTMLILVPAAFLMYYAFHLSIWVIFPAVLSLDFIKVAIGFFLLKKKVWLNNIVKDDDLT